MSILVKIPLNDINDFSMPGVSEIFKIGVGPSSSHTLGPWLAARNFIQMLSANIGSNFNKYRLKVTLYGSLALTGKGHGTDIAIFMGLSNTDPETIELTKITSIIDSILDKKIINIHSNCIAEFDPDVDLVFKGDERLPEHANGMVFEAYDQNGSLLIREEAYSIGGGFVKMAGLEKAIKTNPPTYLFSSGHELLEICETQKISISDLARKNELQNISDTVLSNKLLRIWQVMIEAIYSGITQRGLLPGSLGVSRRAPALMEGVMGKIPDTLQEWHEKLKDKVFPLEQALQFVGASAIAVNEQNAGFGRIVTAPTNGSAGVIPSVILYSTLIHSAQEENRLVERFLLTSSVIGALFKTGATISAAMGGCQAEIGVSSAMAAAALTEIRGGSPEQVLQAAEIAMEHHLGMTCDPIGGLVQIPCIERNAVGAVKAIMAAQLALSSEPKHAKVSLDDVIRTMWSTAQDMNDRYKETSLGGLAVQVSVKIPEC